MFFLGHDQHPRGVKQRPGGPESTSGSQIRLRGGGDTSEEITGADLKDEYKVACIRPVEQCYRQNKHSLCKGPEARRGRKPSMAEKELVRLVGGTGTAGGATRPMMGTHPCRHAACLLGSIQCLPWGRRGGAGGPGPRP